jgi:hypothetical protein
MTIKGLAVISGSGENQGDIKHKLLADGDVSLGATGATSTLSGTINVLGMDPNLVSTINTLSGTVVGRITTSLAAAGPSGTKTVEVNTTSVEMVGDANRLHGTATGTFTTGSTTLYASDVALDNQLSASRDSITTVTGGTDVDGSLAKAIDQHLKGPGLTGTLATISALSSSILDTDLTGTVATAISQMKNSVYHGTASVTATSDNLSASLANIAAQTVTAVAKEGILDGKINAAVTSIGLEADRSLSYSGTDYIDAQTTIKGAQDTLEAKHSGPTNSNVTRLATMTGSALTTAEMTVVAGQTASFSGDVTTTEFTAPHHNAVPAYLLDGASLKADMSDHEGEMIYLTAATAIAPFTVENKFYFCENGQWFMSPFYNDADGDGVMDQNDAFPNDPSESVDSDGDGVGDNADAYPANPARSAADSAPTGLPVITSPSGNFQDDEVFSVDLSGITDADGAISAVSYSWIIDGLAEPTETNSTLDAANFESDMIVSVEVVVSDGLETYTLPSADVTITASAPPMPSYSVQLSSDSFGYEIAVALDGTVVIAEGAFPNSTTLPLTIEASEVAQTISLTDQWGDGGVTKVEFFTPDGTTSLLEIAPSYGAGPYNIEVTWTGTSLTVKDDGESSGTLLGTLPSTIDVLVTTDADVGTHGWADGTTLTIDGVDYIPTIGPSQTDYVLTVPVDPITGHVAFEATDPNFGDGGVSVTFLHNGSPIVVPGFTGFWGNTFWMDSNNLPVPASILYEPIFGLNNDFRILDASNSSQVFSTAAPPDLNENSLGDDVDVGNINAAVAAGNVETFSLVIDRDDTYDVGNVSAIGHVESVAGDAFVAVDYGGHLQFSYNPLPDQTETITVAHGADNYVIIQLIAAYDGWITINVEDDAAVSWPLSTDGASNRWKIVASSGMLEFYEEDSEAPGTWIFMFDNGNQLPSATFDAGLVYNETSGIAAGQYIDAKTGDVLKVDKSKITSTDPDGDDANITVETYFRWHDQAATNQAGTHVYKYLDAAGNVSLTPVDIDSVTLSADFWNLDSVAGAVADNNRLYVDVKLIDENGGEMLYESVPADPSVGYTQLICYNTLGYHTNVSNAWALEPLKTEDFFTSSRGNFIAANNLNVMANDVIDFDHAAALLEGTVLATGQQIPDLAVELVIAYSDPTNLAAPPFTSLVVETISAGQSFVVPDASAYLAAYGDFSFITAVRYSLPDGSMVDTDITIEYHDDAASFGVAMNVGPRWTGGILTKAYRDASTDQRTGITVQEDGRALILRGELSGFGVSTTEHLVFDLTKLTDNIVDDDGDSFKIQMRYSLGYKAGAFSDHADGKTFTSRTSDWYDADNLPTIAAAFPNLTSLRGLDYLGNGNIDVESRAISTTGPSVDAGSPHVLGLNTYGERFWASMPGSFEQVNLYDTMDNDNVVALDGQTFSSDTDGNIQRVDIGTTQANIKDFNQPVTFVICMRDYDVSVDQADPTGTGTWSMGDPLKLKFHNMFNRWGEYLYDFAEVPLTYTANPNYDPQTSWDYTGDWSIAGTYSVTIDMSTYANDPIFATGTEWISLMNISLEAYDNTDTHIGVLNTADDFGNPHNRIEIDSDADYADDYWEHNPHDPADQGQTIANNAANTSYFTYGYLHNVILRDDDEHNQLYDPAGTENKVVGKETELIVAFAPADIGMTSSEYDSATLAEIDALKVIYGTASVDVVAKGVYTLAQLGVYEQTCWYRLRITLNDNTPTFAALRANYSPNHTGFYCFTATEPVTQVSLETLLPSPYITGNNPQLPVEFLVMGTHPVMPTVTVRKRNFPGGYIGAGTQSDDTATLTSLGLSVTYEWTDAADGTQLATGIDADLSAHEGKTCRPLITVTDTATGLTYTEAFLDFLVEEAPELSSPAPSAPLTQADAIAWNPSLVANAYDSFHQLLSGGPAENTLMATLNIPNSVNLFGSAATPGNMNVYMHKDEVLDIDPNSLVSATMPTTNEVCTITYHICHITALETDAPLTADGSIATGAGSETRWYSPLAPDSTFSPSNYVFNGPFAGSGAGSNKQYGFERLELWVRATSAATGGATSAKIGMINVTDDMNILNAKIGKHQILQQPINVASDVQIRDSSDVVIDRGSIDGFPIMLEGDKIELINAPDSTVLDVSTSTTVDMSAYNTEFKVSFLGYSILNGYSFNNHPQWSNSGQLVEVGPPPMTYNQLELQHFGTNGAMAATRVTFLYDRDYYHSGCMNLANGQESIVVIFEDQAALDAYPGELD